MKKYTTAEKNIMKQQLKDFLISGNYQHQFALITDNSINTLKSDELVHIYEKIIAKIIDTPSNKESTKIILRPICPITGRDKLNQARVDYKKGMKAYIAQFGIHLTDNAPCNYSPAILEAIANYCDHISSKV